MPAISGDEYLKRMANRCPEVWIDGQRVRGDLSKHPAFRGVMQSQAELYDLQQNPSMKECLTSISETTGDRIGTSYLIPKTKADLEKKRKMIQEWARYTGGLMGRSPDYMNTVLASFAASVDILKGMGNCFPDRILKFYEYAKENDLSFTHTFVSPQNNRSKLAFLEGDATNARITKRVEEGLVIKGAKLLATQGGMTDEIIVMSTPGTMEKSQAYAFAIPSDAPGLKFICRQSFGTSTSRFDHPFSSRFDEMDTIVIFDEVIVPWDRVFFHDNLRAANDFYKKGKFIPFTLHQVVSRQVIKTELLLGIAQQMVDAISIGEYQHVQSKVAEIIKGLESMRALLLYAEDQAELDDAGIMVPDRKPLYVAINQFQELYPRFTEIIQLLGASGMMTIPTENDFRSRMGERLTHYLQSTEKDGKERVKLFRLAWDLTMSAFGSRQTHYERFFFGDQIRLSQLIYQTYDMTSSTEQVNRFL